ncbi:hypothetical protein [Amycolatopsis sp. cmx-4-68]|uniref:hypothetical protein n=1 Tax=Amycolatopsis sp. cmx-4-68 TaxID=2790938 RepID=UPI00397CC51C
MIRIASLSALDAWLDERRGFEDGRVAGITQSVDGAVTVRLEENVRLGLQPGDVWLVEVHELVAEAPFAFEPPDRQNPDSCITAVSAAEVDGRLGVEIDGALSLAADAFTARHIGTLRRRTQPWTGDELTVAADIASDGQFWSERVGEVLGAPVVWRVLGGREPRGTSQTIDGCFLQATSRLATTDMGVFCKVSRAGSVTMRRERDAGADLWRAVRLTAARFPRIRSGNCVFTSADWNSYLATNTFPPADRLRGDLI